MSDPPSGGVAPAFDKLAEAFIKIRDARSKLKAQYEAEDKVLADQATLLETSMLGACKQSGIDSVRTPYGTIIRSVKSRYWTNNWDSMYRFIKEHDAFALLEKRLHQTNMKEFLSENPEVQPVGLNVENEYTVVVRRSKGNPNE
jgi:hypothetical protein